jgi:hypothetical protein
VNVEESIEFGDLVGFIIRVSDLTLYFKGNNSVSFNGEDIREGLVARGADWDSNSIKTLLPHHLNEFTLSIITTLLHGTNLFSG